MSPLHLFIAAEFHIITQKIKAKFVVCAVSYVALIGCFVVAV